MAAAPVTSTCRRRSAAANTHTSRGGQGAAALGTENASGRPEATASTRTVNVPARTCTRRVPSRSRRAGRSPVTATGTAPASSAPPRTTSRAFPDTSKRSRVSMKMGMPSAILRKTLSWRFSPPAPAAPPCRRSKRPPSSRRGTSTARPSTLKSTIAIAGGTGKESGVRSQRKRPSTLWAPGARRTSGSPSRSRTTAGRPSSSTDCGHRLSPPGRGRSRARSAWASRENAPP